MRNFFLKLHPADNVLIAAEHIQSGQEVVVDGSLVAARAAVPRYFKIAARKIEKGEKIIKCGMSIGVAVEAIELADLVHTHNIRSDYTASFTANQNGII